MVNLCYFITIKSNFKGKNDYFRRMSDRSIKNLQLDGGCAVFDFTNTVNTRTSSPAHDYLKNYRDVLEWSEKVMLLEPERIARLSKQAAKHKQQREMAFAKVIHARDVLYRLFSKIAANLAPEPRTLDAFNALLSECFGKLQLSISSAHAKPNFFDESLSLDEPLRIIMKSAYDILTDEPFTRLKECPNCGWLFVDKTKNGKRRWCDMEVCGSRDKAKRYYHRKKDEQGGTDT